jgi:twitching motility protein PilT
LPRADGHGRAAALEILIATGTVRDFIKDPNRTPELHDYMRESREQYGMQTFDQHLMDLVEDGSVTYETAMATSSNPADFELQMRTLRRRSRVAAVTDIPAESPAAAPEPDRPSGFTDDLSSMLPGQ